MSAPKTVLVTGCSSGFGRAIAETMGRMGYRVFASMRNANTRNAGARDEMLALAAREKMKLHVIDLDVTDDDSVERAVAGMIADAGRVDILVNNAGYAVFGLTETFTVEQARRIFDTNFFGIVRMNRAVLPHMRHQGEGLIVHITSAGGRGVLPGMGLTPPRNSPSRGWLSAIGTSYPRPESIRSSWNLVPIAPKFSAKLKQPPISCERTSMGPSRMSPAKSLRPSDPLTCLRKTWLTRSPD